MAWKIFHCAEAQHLENTSLKWVANTRLIVQYLRNVGGADEMARLLEMKPLIDYDKQKCGKTSKFNTRTVNQSIE